MKRKTALYIYQTKGTISFDHLKEEWRYDIYLKDVLVSGVGWNIDIAVERCRLNMQDLLTQECNRLHNS
jgi:hypothetical protein